MATAVQQPDLESPWRWGLGRRWWIAATLLPGIAATELAVTGEFLPEVVIVDALETDHYRFSYVLGPYMVVLLLWVALAVWLKARVGTRAVFIATMLCTAAGCLGSASASTLGDMVAAKLVLAGKAGVLPCGLSTLWHTFPRRKSMVTAFFAVSMYGSAAMGAAVGAFLLFNPSWRLTYALCGLAALYAAVGAWRVWPDDRPAHPPSWRSFDGVGAGLLAVFLCSLLYALFWGVYEGWTTSTPIALALLIAAVSGVLFVRHEWRHPEPFLAVGLFRFRTAGLSIAAGFFYAACFWGLIVLMPAYMFDLRGYQSYQIGWVMLPCAVLVCASILVCGRIAERGYEVWLLRSGLVGMSACTLWLSQIDLYTSKYWIAASLAAWGLFGGMVYPTSLRLSFEDQTADQIARTASMKFFMRFFGVITGVTISSAVMVDVIADRADDNLRYQVTYGRPQPMQVFENQRQHFMRQGSSPQVAHVQGRIAVNVWLEQNARVIGYRVALIYLSGLTVVALGFALAIPSRGRYSFLTDESAPAPAASPAQ